MADDLGQLLGTLLTSLVHARRIADEETAAVAEYYRSNPLLEGMSLPRIRVPELVIDLPLLVEQHQPGEADVPNDSETVRKAVIKELDIILNREKLSVSDDFKKQLDLEIRAGLKNTGSTSPARSAYRETMSRTVDAALKNTVTRLSGEGLSSVQIRLLSAELRRKAGEMALKKNGVPSKILASIITSEVKEKAGANNVTRLKIVLREEGLEWSVGENADGTVKQTLTPE